jgi:two-component system, OmpR family, response regulator
VRNILVVDDDTSIGNMLVEYFSQHDFNVSFAENRAELNRHLTLDVPDLLIVDMNLAGENGMEIVRNVTGRMDVPIIVISGDRSKELDTISRLELGAGAYVAKPFSLKDMLARVKTALEVNVSLLPSKVYLFDGWRLNARYRYLSYRSGSRVKLKADEFSLLVALLETAGQVLSREQLVLATRLHNQEIGIGSLDTLILRLRRKLEHEGDSRQYIKTHRGLGYAFDCFVQVEANLMLQ